VPVNEDGDRRENSRILSEAAFEQHRETAGEQFGVIARDRHQTAFSYVERDGGDVRGGIRRPPARLGIVERHHPVGKIVSKSAYVTDGKHVRGDRRGVLAVVERADAAAGEQRLGADAGKRGDGVGAAAQQGQ
jgi:hypothetical protein